jgi:phospholipase D1/2
MLLPALVAIALLIAWQLGYFELARREQLFAVIRRARHAPRADFLYVIAYAMAATLGLPTTVLSIVGGAIFGSARGAGLAWAGAMAGTLTAYTLARSIGKGSVHRFLGRHHLLDRLRNRSDFWTLLRLRVLPVAPFAVLDYVAGLAGVSLRPLLLATALGIVPSVAAYTYVGSELLTGLESSGAARFRALWIAGAMTFVMICISLVPAAIRRFRR